MFFGEGGHGLKLMVGQLGLRCNQLRPLLLSDMFRPAKNMPE